MSVLTKLWPDNPVLTKELRVRMRGARAYWILTGYLAFLSFILFMQYSAWWNMAHGRMGGMSMGSKIGQSFFYGLLITQLFLVAFITPAITSGAITIEKEQRTMEMLEMTRLSRSSIITGKLLSAISFVALLLISSLPLTSICFFLGGVSPEQVVYWYMLLLAVSFVTATLGLVWSSVARTTAAAVVFTYGSLLIVPIAGIVLGALVGASGAGGSNMANMGLVAMLVAGLFGAVMPEWLSYYTPMSGVLHAWDMKHYFGLTLPVWLAPVCTYALLGITLAAVATIRLESFPERKAGKLRLLVLVLMVVQMFFYFGARFTVYSPGAPPGLAATAGQFSLLYMLVYPIVFLLALIPIFATGEIRPVEARNFARYLMSGWTPAGLRRGKIASGLPYLLLLAIVALGMYCLSFVLVGKPGAILKGMPAAKAAWTAPPMGPMSGIPNPNPHPNPNPNPKPNSPESSLPQVALALFASIIGLSALGMLFSTVTRNRWAALALLYVLLVVILVAPPIARADYTSSGNVHSPSIFINLYYLNPLMSIDEATDQSGTFWKDLNLMFGQTPFWVVTSLAYLFIAGVCMLMATPFVMKIASGPVLLYEDMAARV